MKDKNSFIMQKQWKTQFDMLNEHQKAAILDAVYDFQCNKNDFVTDDGMLKMLWASIKQVFDYNEDKYNKRCEQNSINAKKGKRTQANADARIQPPANAADNENDNDNDNVNVNVNVNDSGSENENEITTAPVTSAREKYKFLFDRYSSQYPEFIGEEDHCRKGWDMLDVIVLYDIVAEEPLERYFNKAAKYNCKDKFETVIDWAIADDNMKSVIGYRL